MPRRKMDAQGGGSISGWQAKFLPLAEIFREIIPIMPPLRRISLMPVRCGRRVTVILLSLAPSRAPIASDNAALPS